MLEHKMMELDKQKNLDMEKEERMKSNPEISGISGTIYPQIGQSESLFNSIDQYPNIPRAARTYHSEDASDEAKRETRSKGIESSYPRPEEKDSGEKEERKKQHLQIHRKRDR